MRRRWINVIILTALLVGMAVLPVVAAQKEQPAENTAIVLAAQTTNEEDAAKIANEKATALEKALAEKAEADKAAAAKAAALEKALAEKAAADEKVAAEKIAAEKAAAEAAARLAAQVAAAEQAAVEKAAAEQARAEKVAAEKATAEKAAAEQAAFEAAEKAAEAEAAAARKRAAEQRVAAEEKNKIIVAVNNSQILNFSGVERVAVANPDIADVMIISGSEIMVVGKTHGRTNLHIWSWSGKQSFAVEVAANDVPIASEIKRLLGLNDINVTKVGKTVILEGKTIDKYQKERAEKIASAYGEKVVNLLEITQALQVKIEAKVIEISKNRAKDLGIKWGNDVSAPGSFRFGQTPMNDEVTYKVPDGSGGYVDLKGRTWNNALAMGGYGDKLFGQSLGRLGGYWDINAELNAMVKNGVAKILSQPYTVTLSGESANILVGGQMPVPVSSSNGNVTIEWKDFGIKLDINPEVNSMGLINSKVKAEVSALDWANAVAVGNGMKVPSLTMRKAEAVVALPTGQTMAIGGLYSATDLKSISKLPVLGDIPVLGALFTSKSFVKDETELIVLITPTIVGTEEYIPKQVTPEMNQEVKK